MTERTVEDEFVEEFMDDAKNGDNHFDADLENTDTKDEETEENLDEEEESTEQEENDGSTLWDDATEDQRAEVSKLQSILAQTQHSADSDRGRVKALRAQAQALEEENAALKLASSKQEIVVESDDDSDSDYSDEELDDIEKDLPEVKAIIKRSLKNVQPNKPAPVQQEVQQPQVSQEQNTLQQQQQSLQQQEQIRQVNLVKASHPDFDSIRTNPSYATWLSRSPGGIKALANSPYAEDAIALIGMFKAAQTPVDRTNELDSMMEAPSKGTTVTDDVDSDDFDTAWDHFARLEEQGKL